jgi:hypothetical protein
MNAPDLSPILQRQNSIQNDYAAKSAANTFSRTLSQQRGSRSLTDFRQGFQRQLPSFSQGFGSRGVVGGGISGGIYQRAMRNFVGDYTRDYGRMQQDVFDQDQQFGFNQSRFDSERDSALADLAAQKAALIAQTAQNIASLQPYLGGS